MKIEYFLVVPLIIWSLVSLTVYRSVSLLARPDKLLKDVDDIDDEIFLREQKDFGEWCRENRFSHEKNFLFYGILNGSPIKCSAWWSSATKTWALIYVTHMGRNVDFVTIYESGHGVTTASSKDSLILPSFPESYMQAFTNISDDERYALHNSAASEIEGALQISKGDGKQDLFKMITESLLKQVAYIHKLPFWYLRGAYWYFISRNMKANKKVGV
jgi:hypothetical protein